MAITLISGKSEDESKKFLEKVAEQVNSDLYSNSDPSMCSKGWLVLEIIDLEEAKIFLQEINQFLGFN